MLNTKFKHKKKSTPSDHLLLFIKWTHVYVTEVVQNKYRKGILSTLVHAIHNLHCATGGHN